MKLTDFVKLLPPRPHHPRRYWTAKIGDAGGEGADKDAAINALQGTIERAFEGYYTSYLMSFRGHQVIVWRTTHNWTYKILDPDDLKKTEGKMTTLWGVTSYDTEKEILRSVRYHLAQIAWDGEEETSPIILEEEDQDKFGRDARWQKRYKALKATGMDDTAIREQLRLERM